MIGWSGDAVQLQADNPNIEFRMPDEGCMLWSDNMVIPVGAPNPTAAEAWMNYVYDPKNQAQIEEYVNYVSPGRRDEGDPAQAGPRAGQEPAGLPDRAVHEALRHRAGDHAARRSRTITQAFEAVVNGVRRRRMRKSRARPRYLLLGPGLLWLILFFVIPLYYSGKLSLYGGARSSRASASTGTGRTSRDSLSLYDTQFLRSFVYAGTATILCLLIGYPLAYAIAFKAGRWRNLFLFAVVAPVLHHLPDPDARLGDDPLRPEPGGQLPADRSGSSPTTATCWRPHRR